MTDDKSLRLRVRVSSAISSFRELSGFLRLPRDPRHWELTPGFREAFILGAGRTLEPVSQSGSCRILGYFH
jgi:hypothetical protein